MTSDEDNDVRVLPRAAEALLGDWPLRDRDALSWDLLAEKTTRGALEAGRGSTDAALLAPPLPRLPEESELVLEPDSDVAPTRVREEMSSPFADIARAAVSLPGKPDNDTTMAREGLSLAARARRNITPAPPLVVEEEREDTPLSAVETVRSHGAPALPILDEAPRAKVVELPFAPSEPPEDARARRSVPILIAGALAAAAAIIVLVRVQDHGPATVSIAAETAANAPAPVPPSPAPMAEGPSRPEQRIVSLDELPSEGQLARKSAPSARELSPKGGSAQTRVATRSAPPAPADVVLEEETSKQNAAPAAEGAGSGMVPAAQTANTTTPLRPSTGAVHGAMASVLPPAQGCLDAGDPGSTATVTFGSDGHVQRVQITGPAAGTPAEDCIRQKLSGAQVPPFSEPSFQTTFTVRPRTRG